MVVLVLKIKGGWVFEKKNFENQDPI